jgi:hypothetical protein
MADESGYPPKVTFDATAPNPVAMVRKVFWNRLRADTSFTQLKGQDGVFRHYVEFALPRYEVDFDHLIVDVYWELVGQGVICPGTTTGNPSPPTFHLTDYGRNILRDANFDPHSPDDYMKQLEVAITAPDPTVLAYLRESLISFHHGTMVAAAMMLGIASERVFLLICDSLSTALADANEQTAFTRVVERNPIKPKLDWVVAKFQRISTPKRPADWPDDADIQLTGIFNLIRCQRNDVGHPREKPPSVSRDVAFGYLRIFPSYYATAERVRDYLSMNKV